jgi:hypothetical protein
MQSYTETLTVRWPRHPEYRETWTICIGINCRLGVVRAEAPWEAIMPLGYLATKSGPRSSIEASFCAKSCLQYCASQKHSSVSEGFRCLTLEGV